MEYPEHLQSAGISKRAHWKAVSLSEGFPFLDEIPHPTPSAVAKLSEENMKRYRSIVFSVSSGSAKIAVDDPLDYDTKDALTHLVDGTITFYTVLPEAIDKALSEQLKERS